MSNELISASSSAKDTDLAALKKLEANDFPGFIKVMNGQSTEVLDEKASAGTLILKKGDDITDLGKEIDIIPVAFRMTATTFVGDDYHAYHNPDSAEYLQIEDNSKDKELKRSNKHGPEFLVWIPSLSAFATIHLSTYSNWPAARPLKANMNCLMTLVAEKKSNPKFKWWAFNADTSVNSVEGLSLPEQDGLQKRIDDFENAPDFVPSADKEKANSNVVDGGQAR